MIRVKAYGLIADIVGAKEIEADTLSDTELLRQYLVQQYFGLEGKQFVMAIGNKIVSGKQAIHEGDTISLLPPFSGG